MAEKTHSLTSYITGHHIYKKIWSPKIGEELVVLKEEGNKVDRTAVGVFKGATLVGHVPRSDKATVRNWLQMGIVTATVIGKRENKRKNGLEVPAMYELKKRN